MRNAILEAGREIMRIYDAGKFSVSDKEDNSPVTEADLRANEVLLTAIHKHFPEDGILSEEDSPLLGSFPSRFESEYVWIIDPIDGTREFVLRNGMFATSVALAKGDKLVAGAVHAPAESLLKITSDIVPSTTLPVKSKEEISLCISRSEDEQGLFEDVKKILSPGQIRIHGSIANKLARLANDECNLVVSRKPKNEWDIAGGYALIREKGWTMVDGYKNDFSWNKRNTETHGVVAGEAGAVSLFFGMF